MDKLIRADDVLKRFPNNPHAYISVNVLHNFVQSLPDQTNLLNTNTKEKGDNTDD